MDDVQLRQFVTLFLEGDQRAFYKIVDEYKDEVFNLCYRIIGDYDDADDVAQEVFIRVFKSIAKFRFDSSFSTWLYRIAVNCCNSTLKKRLKRKSESIENYQESLRDDYSSDTAYSDIVRQAIAKLDKKDRTIIILRDINGLSYDEIATIINITVGTVKSRLSRAREKLKAILRRLL